MSGRSDTQERDTADMKMDHVEYATKSDVAAARSAMILWCVGTIIAMSGVAFAVAKLVH
ncbi:hypothetical protein ACWYXK_17545 [Janthinobacterium lividum]|uniref:Uncharacterized protein n=1 Tax=Janthinobacterium lividum TaxID=29581 RepID=A0ABU0Y2A2_9BURK|nr:hypothetical protein [Janthinobacterium lividum]MDQ4628866.1 hypothetical protein [Janthinobacterium lividum]MDQ4677288.1 hypothetical protein [Janthinobacterium lividum]MDQ4687825.1 hypothetical protein [Janthinobacterium lividum]